MDSPNLFGQALEQLFSQFEPVKGIKLLQYVDDLLVAGPIELDVKETMIRLLNFLGDQTKSLKTKTPIY